MLRPVWLHGGSARSRLLYAASTGRLALVHFLPILRENRDKEKESHL